MKIKLTNDVTIELFFSYRGQRTTRAEIYWPDSSLAVGIAICHPKDKFIKFEGRKRALTKALVSLDKVDRSIIWNRCLKQWRLPK